MNDESSVREDRQLDMESLKALAHPLRVQILDTLTVYGDFTASGLAERLGESSGATSYHLRQLERHGFVREVAGKGVGRERWWERVPGGLSLRADRIEQTPANRAVIDTVVQQWDKSRSQLFQEYQERGFDELTPEWFTASGVATVSLRMTREQLAEVTTKWDEFITPFIDRFRGQDIPGSRPVQIQFNAFPVIDGAETPADSVGGDE